MEGEICANWLQWTDIKRIKENDAITAIEIEQSEREVLSVAILCSHVKDRILNFSIITSK